MALSREMTLRVERVWAQPEVLKVVLLLLFNLNLFDTVVTLLLVWGEVAFEVNPFMAGLLRGDSMHFVVAKISLVGLGCLLLWRLRANAFAIWASYLLVVVYLTVAVYQLVGVLDALV